jgi:hypothetical protein
MTRVGSSGECATALPIALKATMVIPMATAVPIINCVMLVCMIASREFRL